MANLCALVGVPKFIFASSCSMYAAGGYALTVANFFGIKTKYEILPFKGLYLKCIEKN